MSIFFDPVLYARNVQNAKTPEERDRALTAIAQLPEKKQLKAARALEMAIINEMDRGFGEGADSGNLLMKFHAVHRLLGGKSDTVTHVVREEAAKVPQDNVLESSVAKQILERAAARTGDLREENKVLTKLRRYGL